jgi:putative flippase GtrA
VFEQKSWARKTVVREALSFYGARAVSFVMDLGLTALFYEVLWPKLADWFTALWSGKLQLPGEAHAVYEFITKLIFVQLLVMILNYIFSKLFIFKKKSGAQS